MSKRRKPTIQEQYDALREYCDEMNDYMDILQGSLDFLSNEWDYLTGFIHYKKLEDEYHSFRENAHKEYEEDLPFPRLTL